MRPRVFPTSQQELGSACDALRRAYARPEPSDRGPLIAVFFWLALLVWCMTGFHTGKPILYHGTFWHIGETRRIYLPHRQGTADIGQPHQLIDATLRWDILDGGYAPDPAEVRIGDMYRYKGHFWIFAVPNGGKSPTWIDP